MNKILLAVLLTACAAPMVNAQTSGVTTSTDSARIAAIERHASALKAGQASHKAAAPMHSAAKPTAKKAK